MLSVAAGVSRIQPVTATQQMAKRIRRIESKRLHPIFEQSGGGGVQSCQYDALSAAGGVVLKRCCANFWHSTVSIWGPVHLDVILALDAKMAQIMILQRHRKSRFQGCDHCGFELTEASMVTRGFNRARSLE